MLNLSLSMQYALTPRIFIFSHYFYTGLRIGVGIIGLTLITLHFSNLPTALAVAMGAICTAQMDLPSPLRHKFYEMLAGVLLCSAVSLVAGLCSPYPWLLGVVVVLVTFLASMMVVYGRKAIPLQYAAIFVMMLSADKPAAPGQALVHAGLFFAGGMAYLCYAMIVVWLLRKRLKQQVLAEALYALVRYVEIKADCYDEGKELNAQFEKLVRQQSVLAEKQQAARDLILRGHHTEDDLTLVQVHYAMLDLYELVLATHSDYPLLRKHFAGTEVLRQLRTLICKAARDIEAVAYAMLRGRPPQYKADYTDEICAIEQALRQADTGGPQRSSREARAVLRAAVNKEKNVLDMIAQLHRATHEQTGQLPVVVGSDMTPFLTQQRYEFGTLVSNLRWSSPIFRFALRVALAISTGLLAADFLPYSAHGYWIALTIAVILKPSFSITKQRRADRLIGTVIGCVITAIVLRFVHSPVVLIGLLFLATAAAPAFLHVKYRYTAIAASMQILLLIGLTVPNAHHAVGERLLDTLIGGLIATFFSYVLPSWEYQALPRLLANVLKENRHYVNASRDLLLGHSSDDFLYRISRKRLMDSLSSLSAAIARMLDEPAGKHRAVEDINRFTVQNYLLVSHFAAVRLLLQRYKDGMPEHEVNLAIDQLCNQVHGLLAQAQRGLEGRAPEAVRSDFSTAETAAAGKKDDWKGWEILRRRLRLLLEDADRIADESRVIGQALGTKAA